MKMERQDILDTIGTLTNAEYWLRAFAMVGNEETKKIHEIVRQEAERLRNLYTKSDPGEKELFRERHPPLYDQLDGLYDCGSDKCPARGFKSKESKDQHYLMWDIEPRR